MHTAPADLSVSELRTALVTGWRIEPSSITYASVGFGSHHWTVVEPSSRRWFVTADAIADSSTRLADLNAALRTALALRRDAGLEFVWAPATADTELSWHGAVAICKRLSAGTPGPPWASQS
jgi:hypothetical protein